MALQSSHSFQIGVAITKDFEEGSERKRGEKGEDEQELVNLDTVHIGKGRQWQGIVQTTHVDVRSERGIWQGSKTWLPL
jgi:hypothetical protein